MRRLCVRAVNDARWAGWSEDRVFWLFWGLVLGLLLVILLFFRAMLDILGALLSALNSLGALLLWDISSVVVRSRVCDSRAMDNSWRAGGVVSWWWAMNSSWGAACFMGRSRVHSSRAVDNCWRAGSVVSWRWRWHLISGWRWRRAMNST